MFQQRLSGTVICHLVVDNEQDCLGPRTTTAASPSASAHAPAPASPVSALSGAEILAQYECSAGGNGAAWTSAIMRYNGWGTLISDLLLLGYTQAEHVVVTNWKPSGSTVKMS
ncbi:MAG: hypothetical protein ABI382_10225 [Nakamurella sp.]